MTHLVMTLFSHIQILWTFFPNKDQKLDISNQTLVKETNSSPAFHFNKNLHQLLQNSQQIIAFPQINPFYHPVKFSLHLHLHN